MIPVVAIVGRPNVGKSTLFNRLTQSRNALISDFPGMTRDRQYGEAHIADHRFMVIDTGGITDEKTDLTELTVKQSWLAIQEADIILFVLDGREEMTSNDFAIVKKLRALNKIIFPVINKTEDKDPELIIAEFYRLGFSEPIPISAAHGTGIIYLVETIFQNKAPVELNETINTNTIQFAIVGRPNVGKSTLTNRMLGEERVIVCDQPGTTRDSIFIPLKRHEKDYTLIDTAGVRRRGKRVEITEKFSVVKTLKSIEASHVILFLLDAREGVTEQDLRLLDFVIENGKAIVIVFNKWDGMHPDERETTRKSFDRRLLHFVSFARIHYISALYGSGVGNLFDSIDEAYRSAHKKLSTPELTRILAKAIVQHSPPLVNGRRIKLRYAHAGGQNPPRVIIHGNQVDALPMAYRRYLATTFQTKLKLKGTPVQIELKVSENPYRHHKNTLTRKQEQKKKRLRKYVKKK